MLRFITSFCLGMCVGEILMSGFEGNTFLLLIGIGGFTSLVITDIENFKKLKW